MEIGRDIKILCITIYYIYSLKNANTAVGLFWKCRYDVWKMTAVEGVAYMDMIR